MKQRAAESIDCFAYRFKNNLHRLSKLGEVVESKSPQFIMSQFISKTKTDIQKHLVLKADEYKDLSEIIEVAKQIERSFSPGGHSNTNKPQGSQPEPSSSTTPPTPGALSQPSPPLFSMPTLPTSSSELSVNLNRTILSCQVTSAGKQLQLPLDSCCSVTLCSLDHAQLIHSERPELNYKKLEKPIQVQMADTSASLTAVAVQEVPIMWLPNKETIHVALVVPNMSWPLLFGKNHLAATQALSDHSNKTVTFRHPAMNFTVACNKTTASQDPQAAVTCLLTGKTSFHSAPTRTTVYRGFNLVTVYRTLSAASMGSLGNDLWLSGHELEPGVKSLTVSLVHLKHSQLWISLLTLTPHTVIFLTSRRPVP